MATEAAAGVLVDKNSHAYLIQLSFAKCHSRTAVGNPALPRADHIIAARFAVLCERRDSSIMTELVARCIGDL